MKYALLPFLLLSMIMGGSLQAQSLQRGPYLQKPTSSSMVVMWRTDVSAPGVVHYGTSPTALNDSVVEGTANTDHTVEITGLDDNATYYYAVSVNGVQLAGGDDHHHFKTSPIPGTVQPIRIWATGDFGKGNTEQRQVRDSYIDYTGQKTTDVWIWLGDNAYDDGTDAEYQTKVFDIYDSIFRYMPFMPCPGNHDYNSISPVQSTQHPDNHSGPYYDIINVPTNGEAGGVPSGREHFYSYDYGNVHFVSLNSELGSPTTQSHDWIGVYPFGSFNGSPLVDWLRDDLSQNDKKWTIIYFHQPPYSKGSHDSDDIWEVYMEAMRENFVPIFDEFGVDLVVNGHSHVYERSYLIHGHYGDSGDFDPNTNLVSGESGYDSLGESYTKLTYGPDANKGTLFAVVGCSGSKTSSPELGYPAMFYGAGGDTTIGSMVIDVMDNRLDAHFVRADGSVLDPFTIYKVDSLGTGLHEVTDVAEAKVYPNPFDREVTIEYELFEDAPVSIKLYTGDGKLVYSEEAGQQQPGKHTHKIDAAGNDLPNTTYILQVKVGQQVIVKTLFKI